MFASLFLRVKCTSTTIKRNMLYRKWNASFPFWWWGIVHECGETLETSDRKLNCTKIGQIAPLQIIIITVVVQIHIVSSVFEFFYLNVYTMGTVKKSWHSMLLYHQTCNEIWMEEVSMVNYKIVNKKITKTFEKHFVLDSIFTPLIMTENWLIWTEFFEINYDYKLLFLIIRFKCWRQPFLPKELTLYFPLTLLWLDKQFYNDSLLQRRQLMFCDIIPSIS